MEQLIKDIKAQIEAILSDIDKADNKAAKARVRRLLSNSRSSESSTARRQ